MGDKAFVSNPNHWMAKSFIFGFVLLMTLACESNRGPEVRILAQKTASVSGESSLEQALEIYDTFFFFGGTLGFAAPLPVLTEDFSSLWG